MTVQGHHPPPDHVSARRERLGDIDECFSPVQTRFADRGLALGAAEHDGREADAVGILKLDALDAGKLRVPLGGTALEPIVRDGRGSHQAQEQSAACQYRQQGRESVPPHQLVRAGMARRGQGGGRITGARERTHVKRLCPIEPPKEAVMPSPVTLPERPVIGRTGEEDAAGAALDGGVEKAAEVVSSAAYPLTRTAATGRVNRGTADRTCECEKAERHGQTKAFQWQASAAGIFRSRRRRIHAGSVSGR